VRSTVAQNAAFCVTLLVSGAGVKKEKSICLGEGGTIATMQNAAFSEELSSLASIARDLLVRQPGDRIRTVLEYQERLDVGSGTVQARLRTLASIGAIRLRSRGHQGRCCSPATWASCGIWPG
jgi:hypothetical protein